MLPMTQRPQDRGTQEDPTCSREWPKNRLSSRWVPLGIDSQKDHWHLDSMLLTPSY